MFPNMPPTWTTKKIGELCNVSRGSSPRPIHDQRYFSEGRIPWIKIADATKSGKYLFTTKQYVNEFGASFSKLLPPGTIIVAASGTLGYTQILGVEGCAHDGWLILQNLREFDRDYAYYTLQWMRQHFYNSAYGAAIQNINTAILRETEIPYPPLRTQQKIAAVLSAYDDLIENNTRRIQILEEMAQAIYRQWFVEFEYPGHETVPLVDSGTELGEIPQGWEVVKLGDLTESVRRNIKPGELKKETPYFGLEHLPRKSIALNRWNLVDDVGSTKLAFQRGEILFGKIRPYFHKVGVAPLDGIGSSDIIVIQPKKSDFFGLVLAIVSSEKFVEHSTLTSQGTKMPRANWNVLVEYPIALPSDNLLKRYNSFMQDTVELIRNYIFKNANLRATRDLLLPRLVSGEVGVEGLEIEEN